MKLPKYNLVRNISCLIFLTALLAAGITYPFLRGDYDPLAMPISIIIQVFGVVGLSLVPIGILLLTMPRYRFGFTITALIVSTFISLIISLFATLSVGKSFGVFTLLLWAFILARLIPKVKSIKKQAEEKPGWLPVYLIYLPVFCLVLQLTIAGNLTQLSRKRAIENAGLLIRNIEEYSLQNGQYPMSLQAQHKDYNTDVVGVEKYLYAPQGKSYNLSFEQPRFLLDQFGTREWVVYNPLDENSMHSHTASHFSNLPAASSQGWYASGNTEHQHWKYFLFD